MGKPNPMGATFAERAAAARGDEDFTAPEIDKQQSLGNTSFAERAGIESKVVTKDGDAETKTPRKRAVKS